MKEFYAPPLEMYRRMAEEKMLGGLLPRLLAWGADAKLGVAMRRERQVRAIKHDWSRSGRDGRIRSRWIVHVAERAYEAPTCRPTECRHYRLCRCHLQATRRLNRYSWISTFC